MITSQKNSVNPDYHDFLFNYIILHSHNTWEDNFNNTIEFRMIFVFWCLTVRLGMLPHTQYTRVVKR